MIPRPVFCSLCPLVLMLVLLACGSGHGRHAAMHSAGSLAELFPRTGGSLLAAPPLRALHESTLAVMVVPSLERIGTELAPTARDAGLGAALRALGRSLYGVFGQELLELERLRMLGIDVGAPAALALIDAGTAALVLRLADKMRFSELWPESADTVHVVHDDHVVIAFAVGEELDVSAESIGRLHHLEQADSLAMSAALAAVQARLPSASHAAVFVNTRQVRMLVRDELETALEELGIEDRRELVELAEHGGDRDVITDAHDELWAAERAAGELRLYEVLVEELLRPIDSAAVGLGIRGSTITLTAALALDRDTPRAWSLFGPLPAYALTELRPGIGFAVRLSPAVVPTLLEVVLGRDGQRLAKLVSGAGGVPALTGDIEVTLGAERRDGMLVRLGLRKPADVVGRLRRAQRPAAGLRAAVEGRYLVVRSGDGAGRMTRSGDGRGSAVGSRNEAGRADAPSLAAHLLTMPEAGGRFVVELVALGQRMAGSASAVRAGKPARMLPIPTGDAMGEYRSLHKERAELEAERRRRLEPVVSELWRLFGTAAGLARRQEHGITIYAAVIARAGHARHLVGQGMQAWYEQSEHSPLGTRIAAIDARLQELEASMTKESMLELLGSNDGWLMDGAGGLGGASVPGARSGIGSVGGGGSSSGGLGGSGGGGSSSGGLGISVPGSRSRISVSGRMSGSPDRAAAAPHFTASISTIDATLERRLLDEALLGIEPRLSECFREHQARHPAANGYLIAELQVAGGALSLVEMRPASAAVEMASAELGRCVERAVESIRLPTARSGAATASLWLAAP